jgi:hypothetical protein
MFRHSWPKTRFYHYSPQFLNTADKMHKQQGYLYKKWMDKNWLGIYLEIRINTSFTSQWLAIWSTTQWYCGITKLIWTLDYALSSSIYITLFAYALWIIRKHENEKQCHLMPLILFCYYKLITSLPFCKDSCNTLFLGIVSFIQAMCW